MMEWIILWLFCGIITASIASGKGRDGCAWLLIGLLVGPFGFAVALLPKITNIKKEGLVKCPFCAELIKAEAVKCRLCGSDIGVTSQTILAGARETNEKKADPSTKIGYICLAILLAIIVIMIFNVIISYTR